MTRSILVAAGLVVAASLPASGQVVMLTASLDGLQEVPPVITPGHGSATIMLNISTGFVEVSGSYFDLLTPVRPAGQGAHIHGLAPVGVNAGVILGLDHTGGTTGTFSGSGTLTPAQVQGMLDELTYINIHSDLHPGGEIRGQIIPAPGALAILGIGGLFACRRRR